ncbi:hypothetical protein [Leptolyngbya ohadii]|uniref:hypothetical protein n=1 Tax=Leptolyngbya ohadii TaxID=1962290 RepID=UPI000B599CB7|nr:hypothetical protein [Leptolyngbya ohadii]
MASSQNIDYRTNDRYSPDRLLLKQGLPRHLKTTTSQTKFRSCAPNPAADGSSITAKPPALP